MVSEKSNLKFIPIAKPYLDHEEEVSILEVIRTGWISQGTKVEEFERKVAEYVGARYAVATSSGTTALHIALLVIGIGKGDEVIVPSFSFIATANAIVYCSADPVFIDIDPETYNIDHGKIKEFIEKKCRFDFKKRILFNKQTGVRIKAIMPVHQFGLPCDMDKILEIARRYNLVVIEDAACALGSKYKNKMIGSISKLTCFSFHPRKVLTTGEGGMIVTNNKEYAKKAKALRNHGIFLSPLERNSKGKITAEKYASLGYNYRLTDLQAAIGLSQMSKLSEILSKRKSLAELYDEVFKKLDCIQIPYIPPYATPNYQSYVIQLKENSSISRDNLIKELKKEGISVRRGNTAIHLQPLYRQRKFKLPNTEEAALDTLALPIFPEMTKKKQDYVTDRIISLIGK